MGAGNDGEGIWVGGRCKVHGIRCKPQTVNRKPSLTPHTDRRPQKIPACGSKSETTRFFGAALLVPSLGRY